MEQPVKGQVAIVTGAGQGIGRAIALRLSQDGMNLVLADLQGDAVAHVADEIRAGGGEALALSVNILHVDDRQRMIQTGERRTLGYRHECQRQGHLLLLPTGSPAYARPAQRAHRQYGLHRWEDGEHDVSSHLQCQQGGGAGNHENAGPV